MKDGSDASGLQWRRVVVNVLIGATTLAVASAAIGTTADILYVQLTAIAMVGIALMLEPNVTAQPGDDTAPRSSRLFSEPQAARARTDAVERFDPTVEAASV